MRFAARCAATAVLAALLGGASATAQDAERPAEASREDLARLVRALGYRDRVRALVEPELRRSADYNPDSFWKSVDWGPMEDYFAGEFGSRLDGDTVRTVLEYLGTGEGRRWAALRKFEAVEETVSAVLRDEFRQPPRGGGRADFQKAMEAAFEKALGTVPRIKIAPNETAAIATLRNMASCQAQLQTMGKIDCDCDGVGEFGTFLEMTGSVGVRKQLLQGNPNGSSFAVLGTKLNPAVMSASLANVDSTGVVTKAGYCYRVYLPDTNHPAGFVHETGPAASVSLTGPAGVDLAETTWCAYAWPIVFGVSGRRCFFVNQDGDVLQSSNRTTRWSGMDLRGKVPEKQPAPDSAFLGAGITSRLAVGTRGRDGEVWTRTD